MSTSDTTPKNAADVKKEKARLRKKKQRTKLKTEGKKAPKRWEIEMEVPYANFLIELAAARKETLAEAIWAMTTAYSLAVSSADDDCYYLPLTEKFPSNEYTLKYLELPFDKKLKDLLTQEKPGISYGDMIRMLVQWVVKPQADGKYGIGGVCLDVPTETSLRENRPTNDLALRWFKQHRWQWERKRYNRELIHQNKPILDEDIFPFDGEPNHTTKKTMVVKSVIPTPKPDVKLGGYYRETLSDTDIDPRNEEDAQRLKESKATKVQKPYRNPPNTVCQL